MKSIALLILILLLLTAKVYATDVEDWVNKGNNAVNSGDYKQGLEWFTKAADQGDARAQFKLGLAYEGGKAVPQDYKKSLKWYTKAAEQG